MPNSSVVEIRAFVPQDYECAVGLWGSIEGMGLNESDTEQAINQFLERNPDFSAVATVDSVLIGTVLCGHNGRAGFLYHLAVAPQWRGQGVGKRLVGHSFRKLTEANIPRCNIFVYTSNDEGNQFWLRDGWIDPTTWKVLQKRVRTEA